MFAISFTSFHSKLTGLLSFMCLVAALLAVATRKTEATRSESKSTAPESSKFAQSKANGKIVFASDRKDQGFKIWTMNPDGSNPTQLTDNSLRDPSLPSYAQIYDQTPKWSPDGTKIAFRSFRKRDNDEDHAIYLMNSDGSNLQRVVIDMPGVNEAPQILTFDWSRDGTRFVFEAGNDACATEGPCALKTNLFAATVDGKNLFRLTNDDGVLNSRAASSPDGTRIVFTTGGFGRGSINIMNSDGSNRRVLASGSDPAWSSDGSSILFVGSNNESCYNEICDELFVINADGSKSTQLTNYAGSYLTPKYSPDGAKILFGRHSMTYYETHNFPFGARVSQDNGYGVFVMNADGSNQINISNHADDYDPDWQQLPAPANYPAPSLLGLTADLYMATEPAPPKIQITVNRGGELNQIVSCAYRVQWEGGTLAGLPQGTLSFLPGEASKTIEFSSFYSPDLYYVHLSNNYGNATLAGGIRDAILVFAGHGSNPIDKTDFFVRQQYEDFLNRDPDESGWRFWDISVLICGSGASGAPCRDTKRSEVSAAFFLSTEFQETGYLVDRIYKVAYGNLPGSPVPVRFNEFLPDTRQIGDGVVVNQGNWQQQLEANKQKFISEFVQRSRFTLAYPTFMTPVQFVDGLFANAGVLPSVPERESAIGEFSGAAGSADNAARARALRRVAENAMLQQQEFNRAFVLMQYFGYLRRDPNSGVDASFDGYNFWLNKLNQFNGDYNKAEMVKAFISSGEYRQRFGP